MRYLPFILLLCCIHIKCFTQTNIILTNQVNQINLKPTDYILIRNRGNVELISNRNVITMAQNDEEILFKAVSDVNIEIKGFGVVSIYSQVGGNQDMRVIGHRRQGWNQKQGGSCKDGYVGSFCISKYNATSDLNEIQIKQGEQKLLKINNAIILKKWQTCLEAKLCHNQHLQNCQQLHPRDTILTKKMAQILKIRNKCSPPFSANIQKQYNTAYLSWSQLQPPSIRKSGPTFIYQYKNDFYVNIDYYYQYGIGVILFILLIGFLCKCKSNRRSKEYQIDNNENKINNNNKQNMIF